VLQQGEGGGPQGAVCDAYKQDRKSDEDRDGTNGEGAEERHEEAVCPLEARGCCDPSDYFNKGEVDG